MKLWKAVQFVFFLSISQNSIAAIGSVTEQVATPPSIQRQNKTLTGSKGTTVEMMDAIRTAQGKVAITFQDDTKVQVNENSRLVIDDFVYDPNKKSGKLAAKVAMGTVRYASGQIAKNSPQNVAVTTPSATISVRGTDFTATVDEVGSSTIILLPSCPNNRGSRSSFDIEKDCVTGSIIVESDVGQVILNQPFQATKVENRSQSPAKPVILKLSEDAINNLLILAPPKEFNNERTTSKIDIRGALDIDFLAENSLINELDKQKEKQFEDRLSRNFLDNDFLANILDIIDAQLAAQVDLLNRVEKGLLPDYVATSGVVVTVDELKVELCRDNGSDIQCIQTPRTQDSTITQIQGAIEVKNRINQGAGTSIKIIQR